MKTYYKDCCGSYSITEHRDRTATLLCWATPFYGGKVLGLKKTYKSLQGARIALGRYCGGMPDKVRCI